MHKEEYGKIKSSKEQNGKQGKITSFAKENFNFESEEALARIMIRQNASFYFFDDPDVKRIFSKAYPDFEIRGRGRLHFQRIVIPRMAENIRKEIVQDIENSFYAITSDGWSQPSKSPHLQSITVHWIDKNFRRNDKVLLTFSMTERHTGENISKNLSENLIKNGLTNEKLICLVRDDASNNNDINENEINNDVASTASSDESPKYDIWRNPISPGSISLPSAGESSLSKRLTVQLGAFRAIDRPCHDADLFIWWHRNGPQYPDLQRLARIVHVIPSASICSERLFSKAGLIYANTLRNKLSAEMVDKILVIKANLDKLMMGPSALLEKEEKDDEEADNE